MTRATMGRIEVSGPNEFAAFLSNELGLSMASWKPENVNSQLAPYIRRLSAPESPLPPVEFHIPDASDSASLRLNAPWDHYLDQLGHIVSAICAAGGSAAFSGLVKAWLEERKARRIVIKKDGVELELQGAVSKERLEEMIKMFEISPDESRTLEP